MMSDGRAALELAVSRGIEASIISYHKTATRMLVRYHRKANERTHWSFGLRSEFGDFTSPDDPTHSGSVNLFVIEGQLARDVGSPDRWHGRLFVVLNIDLQSGGRPQDDYSRTRALAGIALVR
jgi:hypothetical protein